MFEQSVYLVEHDSCDKQVKQPIPSMSWEVFINHEQRVLQVQTPSETWRRYGNPVSKTLDTLKRSRDTNGTTILGTQAGNYRSLGSRFLNHCTF